MLTFHPVHIVIFLNILFYSKSVLFRCSVLIRRLFIMTLTETRFVVSVPPVTGMSAAHYRDDIKTIWKNADAVCFDVDSTVIQEEAIDELAKFCGKGDDVTNITKKAMGGKLPFGESLKLRLDIIRPTMSQIREFVQTKPSVLSPRIKELISRLQTRGTAVYLISGGFRGLIGPVAIDLNIPLENIYANKLKFYLNGDYAGFDESEPTCQTGGKAKVIKQLKQKFAYNNLVMVGDGMTDLETCPPADAFIDCASGRPYSHMSIITPTLTQVLDCTSGRPYSHMSIITLTLRQSTLQSSSVQFTEAVGFWNLLSQYINRHVINIEELKVLYYAQLHSGLLYAVLF